MGDMAEGLNEHPEIMMQTIVEITIAALLGILILKLLFQRKKVSSLEEYTQTLDETIERIGNSLNISEGINSKLVRQQEVLYRIIATANIAISDGDSFHQHLDELADELRILYDSEYCSIGIVENNAVEDCVVSYEQYDDEESFKKQSFYTNLVRRVDIKNSSYKVCIALNSDAVTSYFNENELSISDNKHYLYYSNYILKSKTIRNTTVIPIRDKSGPRGYVQLINSNRVLDSHDVTPYQDALLQLILLIIEHQRKQKEQIKNRNLFKDSIFLGEIIGKKSNINELLDSIMEYLAKEFKAAVITFRIPLLNGRSREPIFYLRRCYINPIIKRHTDLENFYYTNRKIKNRDQMGGYERLQCVNYNMIIEDFPNDSDYYEDFEIKVKDKALIVPISRDYSVDKCVNNKRDLSFLCEDGQSPECIERFTKLYGIFKLRLLNEVMPDADKTIIDAYERQYYNDSKERLKYLSKQITILFNSLVEKQENESLLIFREMLQESSFVKISEFDQNCTEIICKAIGTKECRIYRYDSEERKLILNADSANKMKAHQYQNGLEYVSLTERDNILADAFNTRKTLYNFCESGNTMMPFESDTIMAVPMLKKNRSCIGVFLLIGKQGTDRHISTSFWEQDKPHVEFIVDVLNRISESDTERLTFLSQLAHELLIPITRLVNDNDDIINTAERNKDVFTKDMLISH